MRALKYLVVLKLTEPLRTNPCEIGIKMNNFSLIRLHLKLSSLKWRSFSPGEMSKCWQGIVMLYLTSRVPKSFPRGVAMTGGRVLSSSWTVNTLRPKQNGCHFVDDIFKCILLDKNVPISIKISLKFVPKGPIDNIPALVRIMAWRRTGDKPLSEPMTTQFNDPYMRHLASIS